MIHLSTAVVPLAAWFLPAQVALSLLVVGVVVAAAVEVARSRVRWVRYQFLTRTRYLLRVHERTATAGATYMMVGYLLAYLLFPLPVAVAAMLYNALGDAAAAIVGKRWGRLRVGWGKSWEGAGAGFVINVLAGLVVPGLPLVAVLLGAAAAAVLEFLPLPIDDNLRVTLGGGAALLLGVAIAG